MNPPLALIVEDQALVAIDIEDEVSQVGFSVFIASTGQEAARWLESHEPDVAIVDIILPDGDCVILARELVRRGAPFAIHSVRTEDEDVDEAFRAARAWIAKPSDIGDVVTAARKVLPGRFPAAA
ncbi:MAG: response regulator [Mesorhizobium sp.]|uniref:response regulator n=1 Tax=Mesorhizobium sp. TaxID=1871066 RepID=UPI000FE56906|nr:response regulator [Mesorhizobium sp.]RWI54668.1 MAG: response regulator [Mesorhizobium sp.]